MSVTTGGFTCQIMNLCKLLPHLPETPASAEHCFPLPPLQKTHELPRMAYCFVSPASLSSEPCPFLSPDGMAEQLFLELVVASWDMGLCL